MIPSTDLRLKSMLRSVTESIMPAIDPQDSLAQEQVKLLLGHLNALIIQQGQENKVLQTEYEQLDILAQFLLTIAEGGPQVMNAVEGVKAALATAKFDQLTLATEHLISATDSSQEFKNESWPVVLDYSRKAASRGKNWFKPMGF